MDERLERLPSLPPGVQAKVYGLLNVEVGRLVWLETSAPYDQISLRIRFFGEQTAGIVLRPSEPIRSYPSNIAQYTIRCNQQTFTKYLNDMRQLNAEVIDDSVNRVLGRVLVNLKLYLRKDDSRGRSNLASDFGFSVLEVQGAFPIISEQRKSTKLGEIELLMKTDYTSWRGEGGVKKSLLSSFLVNELRAEYDQSLAVRPDDDRIPNSLARPPLEHDYRPPDMHGFPDTEETTRAPKSTLKRVEKPQARTEADGRPSAQGRTAEPTEKKEIEQESEDDILAKLRERGEKLRKKMEESAKLPDFATNLQPAGGEDPLAPAFPDIDPLLIPEETFEELPDAVHTEVPLPPQAQPFLDFPSVRYLKLCITTLTVLDQSAVKDRVLCLECTVPTSTLHPMPALPKKSSHDAKPQITLQTDVLKLSHKGGYENIFDFKHESRHNVSIGEGVIGTLANEAIRFRLLATDAKGKESEVGRAELMWEKLLMAPGFAYSVVLELIPGAALEATKKAQRTKGPPVRVREIGRLSAKFELLPEVSVEPVAKQTSAPQAPLSVAGKNETGSEPGQAPAEEVVLRTFQMYLYIEGASQLEPRADATPRNPYIRYKPFMESEFLTTAVLWDWQESSRFNHVLMTPIVTSEAVIAKMSTGRLTIEVWDKRSPSETELMGMVMLPLQGFAEAIGSGAVGIVGSVYPLTAVDEYRAIHNMLKHKDVGYLRVCFALGTPSQVQRLHDSHQSSASQKSAPKEEPPEVIVPKTVKTEEVATSLADLPDAPPNPQSSPEKFAAKVSDSVESIGDIAALLNRKDNRESVPAAESPRMPAIVETKSPERIEPVAPQEIDIEQLLPSVTRRLKTEGIDLSDELRQVDAFSNGFLHSESFARLLEEFHLGFTKAEISAVIDHIIKASDRSSTRKLFHSDILAVLGSAVRRALNTRHLFEVTLTELSACSILKMLPEKSAYLRLQFPLDEGVCESSLLPKEERQPLTMKSTHSCTVGEGQRLEDCIPSSVPGVLIWLCKNEERCETNVLGKAVLPTEELMDLASEGGRLSRVLCLYADKNKAIHSLNSDIVGKVRCQVRYSQEKTSEEPGVARSSELVMERHTTIEMAIPRYSLLTLFVTAATNLDRGASYYENQGVALGRPLTGFVRISLFHESKDDIDDIDDVVTRTVSGSTVLEFSQRFQVDITMTDLVLSYIQTKTALVELVVTEPEEVVFGTAKVALLPVLLSSVKGEFALLNIYGQYMGSVLLALSLNKDDFRPVVDPPEKPVVVEERKETVVEKAEEQYRSVEDRGKEVSLPPARYSPPELRTPLAKLLITIESGIRIAHPPSGGLPNPYVKLIWKNEEVGATPPILRSTCPAWISSFTLPLFDEDLEEMKTTPLIFVLFHKSLSDQDEEFLGRATIDITQLVKPGLNTEISGWYHILLREEPAGQLKVRISPSINLYEDLIKLREHNKTWSTLSFTQTDHQLRSSALQSQIDIKMQSMDESLTNTRDQDLMALHSQKMRDLDQLNEYFSRKIGGDRSENQERLGYEPLQIQPISIRQSQEQFLMESTAALQVKPGPTDQDLGPQEYEDGFNFQPDEILKSIQEASEFAHTDPTFEKPRTPSPQQFAPDPILTLSGSQLDMRASPRSEDSGERREDGFREMLRETPREPVREILRESAKKSSKEAAKESPREPANESPREPAKESPREPARAAPWEAREPGREALREAAKVSPKRERKPPTPKMKVGAEELSRIEAIMRGSGKSTKSRPDT